MKRVIAEKNHLTSTRNPVQTQETVYELSRSRRNEASFKAKLKEHYKRTRKTARNKGSRAVDLGHRETVQTRTDYLLITHVAEASNVINDPKCNKGPKCNNFWP